jgi:misacylated tRNA(Ala) deacylase
MTERIFHKDAYARLCDAIVVSRADGRVILDRTVFYPLGGGQPGDSGELVLADDTRIAVVNTVKGEGDEILHILADGAIEPAVGSRVTAAIDWPRRYMLMRYHTCLHLLCAVVGAPVTGGKMAEDKAHLDFDIEMDRLVAEEIESRLNAMIATDAQIVSGEIAEAELDVRPELVKTMSVQPPRGQGNVRTIEIPGVDLQPCGGTHLRHTSEIGRARVQRIRSEGKRNKRVTIILEDWPDEAE